MIIERHTIPNLSYSVYWLSQFLLNEQIAGYLSTIVFSLSSITFYFLVNGFIIGTILATFNTVVNKIFCQCIIT